MAEENVYEAAERLQDLLLHWVVGGTMDHASYKRLRGFLLNHPRVGSRLPEVIRDRRDARQIQHHLSTKFAFESDRKEFIWETFRPLLEALEFVGSPVEQSTSQLLERLGMPGVHEAWTRALARHVHDPAGAITAARTLLEDVCKHILDDLGTDYEPMSDLPKLYRATAEALNIAPTQHTEPVFKQILGGCTAVVEGLGALRNRVGDAHGAGPRPVRPAPRHAQLAIDLAASVASYLFATWQLKKRESTSPTG
jgi:hypothetical protein